MNTPFNKDANQGQKNQGQPGMFNGNNQKGGNQGAHNHPNKFSHQKEAKLLSAPAEEGSSRGWLTVVIVAAVLLLASGWLISKHNASVAEDSTDNAAMEVLTVVTGDDKDAPQGQLSVTEPSVATGVKITVADQTAGEIVKVSDMSFDTVSWVAIRDAKTKWIKGARWFGPGVKTGDVTLIKPTVAGEKYEAVIYTDDGDKKFDLHKDTLLPGVASSFVAK